MPDDEFARAYSEGYGEGLRDGLRDLLQHASRGHTAQELRILIESRLARVREEVELKRKSVLSPPRRPSWSALLRPPAGVPAPVETILPATLEPGESALFWEPRPKSALGSLISNAPRFGRVLVISFHPPTIPSVPPERRIVVQLQTSERPELTNDPTWLSGRIRETVEPDGGVLVYLDAVEVLANQHGVDPMLRFLSWLTGLAHGATNAVLVSADPSGLDDRSRSVLQRTFRTIR